MRLHRFEGAEWIPEETLRSHLRLDERSPMGDGELQRGLARLLAFRFLRRAGPPRLIPSPEPGLVDAMWPVEALPLVEEVSVERVAAGRRAAKSEREIRELLRTRSGQPFRQNALDEDLEALRRAYVSQGYLLVEAQSTVTERAPGRVAIAIRVDEGITVSIGEIRIAGNASLSRRTLLVPLRTQGPLLGGLLGGALSSGKLVPEEFDEDLERIRDLYRSHGFLDIQVAAEPPAFSPALSRITLSVVVEEGPRYELGEVAIEGNGPGVPEALLLGQIRSREGRPFDGRSLEEDRRRLVIWYEEHYDLVPRVGIRVECLSADPNDTRAAAVFEITEFPHVFAGQVRVHGNERTRDRVIRSRLALAPGGPLTSGGRNESARRLIETGYFEPESLAIDVQSGGRASDVDVTVKERRTGMLGLTGGLEFSTGEGEVATVSIAQPNFDLFALPVGRRTWAEAFSGGGQILEAEIAPGTKHSEYVLRFEEPYLFSSRYALMLQSGLILWDRDGYEENRQQNEISVERLWGPLRRFSTRLGFVFDNVAIQDLGDAVPPDVQEARGSTLLSYPRLRMGWRDEKVNPFSGPRGVTAEARGDLATDATASEAEFSRFMLTFDWHAPVTEWIERAFDLDPLVAEKDRLPIVRLAGRFGWMDELDEPIPFFERFFLGGPRTMRGFDYRGVGPEQSGTRLGGEAFWQATLEASAPLFFREVRAVGLVDFADLEPGIDDFRSDRIRIGAGGGLRIRVDLRGQVIPMDFYFVEAVQRERGDDARVFTFSIGMGF